MTNFPKKIILLGSGELGKEITIAAKRLGCHVIACDRYQNAPAMQVADNQEVLDMTNGNALMKVISKYKPDIIIPEIEALDVNTLKEFEKEGIKVIPNARATAITMNRDLIRNLAANELNLKTAKFAYASNLEELSDAANNIGFPVVIKPIMSSSGKGQTLVHNNHELYNAWEMAIKKARGNASKIIVEEFLSFDLEITLLTIRQQDGSTIFCEPIGHEQEHGDYQCSWQPAKLSNNQLKTAQEMAKKVTDNLGGVGIFGVEFFISKDQVIFSELSPRPHDTGLVTLISQNLNEFEIHLRAILGLPIPKITNRDIGASRVILAEEMGESINYSGLEEALKNENTEILIFGKPNGTKGRRMGVALATGKNLDEARLKANQSAKAIKINLSSS